MSVVRSIRRSGQLRRFFFFIAVFFVLSDSSRHKNSRLRRLPEVGRHFTASARSILFHSFFLRRFFSFRESDSFRISLLALVIEQTSFEKIKRAS